jgi:hypothetical protein
MRLDSESANLAKHHFQSVGFFLANGDFQDWLEIFLKSGQARAMAMPHFL